MLLDLARLLSDVTNIVRAYFLAAIAFVASLSLSLSLEEEDSYSYNITSTSFKCK